MVPLDGSVLVAGKPFQLGKLSQCPSLFMYTDNGIGQLHDSDLVPEASLECSAHESVADREEVEVWNPCIAINHHLSVCSPSSFLVYLNSGPAAAVQEQRQRHWVQPGSVG